MADKPKSILGQTIQHPLTLFPTAIGALGSLGAVLFGVTPLTTGVAIGGLAVGVGSWAVNYFFRSGAFANAQMRQMAEEMAAKKKVLLKDLEKHLASCRTIDGAREHADQALSQFSMVQQCFDNFVGILNDKFSPSEITYGRFYSAAEQVQLSVLDNLQSISGRLQSIRAIDRGYIKQRLFSLSRQKNLGPADTTEKETLEKRLALRDEQLEKVNELLTYNEQALTEIDRTNAAIVEMKSSKSQASADLEGAMQELEELAARAKKFVA